MIVRTGKSPSGGFFFAALFLLLAILQWATTGRPPWEHWVHLVATLSFLGFSIGMAYHGLTVVTWIGFGNQLAFETLLHGIQKHRWAEVATVDIDRGAEDPEWGTQPDKLVIKLVSGKKLELPRRSSAKAGTTIEELLDLCRSKLSGKDV